MFPDYLLTGMGRNFRCDRCGVAAQEIGGAVPPEMIPFIRGQVVVNLRSIGVCPDCYLLVCSACADRGRCPRCGRFLLAQEYPPDPPSWLHPLKRLKWRRVFA